MTIEQLISQLKQFPPQSQVYHHYLCTVDGIGVLTIRTIPRLDFEHNDTNPHLLIKAGEFREDRQ